MESLLNDKSYLTIYYELFFDVKSTSQDHRSMQKQTNDKQQQPKNEKDYMLVKQKAKQKSSQKDL